jgi:hypothetical protein|tara:strand:+ start:8153 stop:8770 length:618 start_codon:yes stop_codon:yes gene_type:complete
MLKLSKKVKRSNLEDLFDKAVKTHPDMSGHMHYLRDLASECEKVVEFGVYKGTGSTIAFISSDCSEYVGYDKNMYAILPEVRSAVAELNLNNNKKYTFSWAEIDRHFRLKGDCDLLFIDTEHTYEKLKLELKNNHSKVKKYIAMHDTHYYADCMNKDGAKDKLIFGVADKGLGHAINEFLDTHPEWKVKYHTDECHGLTVLERVE